MLRGMHRGLAAADLVSRSVAITDPVIGSMSLAPTPAVRNEVLAKLSALDASVRSADLAGSVALFVDDGEALLLGSEAGELARGTAALTELFTSLFALPVRLGWVWDQTYVAAFGDVAWLCAHGMVCTRRGAEETQRPYRITGVLVRQDGEWRWAQFHGSEPAVG